jgi:phosphohistidine swiveling domain-containing protein
MNKKLIISKIKKEVWVKNWSGGWSATFASLYHLYTTDLKPLAGKNLKMNLLLCEKDVRSNFLSKKDLGNYGKHLAGLLIKNNNLAIKWADETLATANILFELLKELKKSKNLTAENFLKLKRDFYIHVPPHFSIKKVVDYLPEKLLKKFTPKFIEVRVTLENIFNEVDLALRAYCKKISQETGHPTGLTEFLTVDEIAGYFKNKKLPSKKDLISRTRGMAIFCEGEDLNILTGNDYKILQNCLFDFSNDKIKGSAAYKGIAKGVARIVFNPFKVKKFNKGDILITGMTRPEFLPLMKKAAALVTDAGGLLSHAAIIARELKKPCILATEKATKTIKDGDLIEVDANQGIVKILKRA